MVRGRCLCGEVQFEADEIPLMTNCHCSMCRKAGGAAFGTFAHARPDQFRYRKGQDLITLYQSSPDSRRGFCRVCGSPIPVVQEGRMSVVIPAGTLDDDPGVRPALHLFTGSKAPFWEIRDNLPQFDEWMPGYDPASRRLK